MPSSPLPGGPSVTMGRRSGRYQISPSRLKAICTSIWPVMWWKTGVSMPWRSLRPGYGK